VSGIFVQGSDVTEAKRAEDDLRVERDRTRAIFESAVDFAIIAADCRGRVTDWNTGAERILGWSAAEMMGKMADCIFTPEDRAANSPRSRWSRRWPTGQAAAERWHLRKDGSRFWASGEMMPLRGGGGAHIGFLKILRDRTEHRQAEEAIRSSEARWRSLFENMHEGFALCELVYDASGKAVDFRHLEVNAAVERLVGIPRSLITGRLASEAVQVSSHSGQRPTRTSSKPVSRRMSSTRSRHLADGSRSSPTGRSRATLPCCSST
jgi:PAS domain S-box-containing protein